MKYLRETFFKPTSTNTQNDFWQCENLWRERCPKFLTITISTWLPGINFQLRFVRQNFNFFSFHLMFLIQIYAHRFKFKFWPFGSLWSWESFYPWATYLVTKNTVNCHDAKKSTQNFTEIHSNSSVWAGVMVLYCIVLYCIVLEAHVDLVNLAPRGAALFPPWRGKKLGMQPVSWRRLQPLPRT